MPTRANRGQKRVNLPLAEGADVVDLTVQLISARSGTAFGPGFRLRAIGRKLYVQMSGRKVPLYLAFDSEPAVVQARALELGAFVQEHGSAFPSEAWREACSATRARKGKQPKARLRLDHVIDNLKRMKLAQGASERTFELHYLPKLRQLDRKDPLGAESLLRVIEATKPFTQVRRRTIAALRQACLLSGVEWNDLVLGPLKQSGKAGRRSTQPFFTDEQIELLLLPGTPLPPPWRRALALMAVYGLRPWEAWVAEPCLHRPDCVWIPIGKKAAGGTTRPRRVPPFHPEWVKRFEVAELQSVDLPAIPSLSDAARVTNRRIRSGLVMGRESPSAYGFRHAYARRLHSARYRVTDTHAALFMGHSVKTHYDVYRDWIGGDDPIGAYLGPVSVS